MTGGNMLVGHDEDDCGGRGGDDEHHHQQHQHLHQHHHHHLLWLQPVQTGARYQVVSSVHNLRVTIPTAATSFTAAAAAQLLTPVLLSCNIYLHPPKKYLNNLLLHFLFISTVINYSSVVFALILHLFFSTSFKAVRFLGL